MSLTPTPVCVQTPRQTTVVLNSAVVAGAVNVLITGGPNGSKVVAITAVNNDTTFHTLTLSHLLGNAVTGTLSNFSMAAGMGNDGATANADTMSLWNGLPRDNDGQKYFLLENNQTLGVGLTSTLAVGKSVSITAIYADF